MTNARPVGVDLGLSDEEKKTLRSLAQATIEARLDGAPLPEIPAVTETLLEKRGAFVSLHRQGRLRGCIGYLQATKPLHQTVQEMALSAAFQDPRFTPLSRDEMLDLEIEISVLTPMQPVGDISRIVIGTHGLMIVKGHQSGLLLPQVASEYSWDRENFLKQTCIKAGLPPDAWQEADTTIYMFSADVF